MHSPNSWRTSRRDQEHSEELPQGKAHIISGGHQAAFKGPSTVVVWPCRGANSRPGVVGGDTSLGKYVRVALPVSIADELIDSRLAVKPIATRGASPAEIFSVTVECINTGSAVVSIAVAAATCRRLAAAAVKRRHPPDPDIITLQITAGGKSKSLTVNRKLPTAEDEAFDFFLAAFDD